MKRLVPFLILCAVLAPAAEARVLTAVKSARAVTFQKPAPFWRDGKTTEARDAVLITVTVSKTAPFLPTALTPAFFMYGNSVCEVLRSPLVDGTAVLLAPRPAAGEAPVLWIGPRGVFAPQMNAEAVKRLMAGKNFKKNALTVPAPDGAPAPYPDVQALEKEIQQPAKEMR